MTRSAHVSSIRIVSLALLAAGQMAGCGGDPASSATAPSTDSLDITAALVACGLDDGTIALDSDLRACDPHDTKKTTICHVPPGNPANAHTICVGNAAVPAHLHNHGDTLGACQSETTCPPPPPPTTDGAGGKGGHGDTSGKGGKGGSPACGQSGTGGSAGGAGTGGSAGAGTGGQPVIIVG